jgi:hypothetical protein
MVLDMTEPSYLQTTRTEYDTVAADYFADGTPNAISTTDGWNYLVRLYRPRTAILDSDWRPPALKQAPN